MGCHSLLQGIFPTWKSNPRSPALQADSLLSEPLLYAKYFGKILRVSFNPQNPVLSPFYSLGNWDLEKISNLFKTKQLVTSGVWIGTQAILPQRLLFNLLLYTLLTNRHCLKEQTFTLNRSYLWCVIKGKLLELPVLFYHYHYYKLGKMLSNKCKLNEPSENLLSNKSISFIV